MPGPAAPQLRLLSPEQQAALTRFYTPPLGGYLFWLLLWNVFLAWVLAQLLSGLGIWPFSTGLFLTMLALLSGLRYWSRARKIKRAAFIYQCGQEDYVTLTSVSADYGLKLNGQPRPVLNLLRSDGQPLRIKTFNERILDAFRLPQQVVYVHPRYPKVVIPSGLFRVAPPQQSVQDIDV